MNFIPTEMAIMAGLLCLAGSAVRSLYLAIRHTSAGRPARFFLLLVASIVLAAFAAKLGFVDGCVCFS